MLVFTAAAVGLVVLPAAGQSDSKSTMAGISKMATPDKMAVDKMSKKEKAAMFNKMSNIGNPGSNRSPN